MLIWSEKMVTRPGGGAFFFLVTGFLRACLGQSMCNGLSQLHGQLLDGAYLVEHAGGSCGIIALQHRDSPPE